MIVGNGGLNVISVGSISNPSNFTISGGPNDFFVFNVGGSLSTNTVWSLDGVTPSQILWNFTASTGTCFQTAGGSSNQFGTFLATNGCKFQFSNLNVSGAVWNTGGEVQWVSGSRITGTDPFNPPQAVVGAPEPLILSGLGIGLLSLAFIKRQRGDRRT
jgi:hypothetical protein